LDPEPPSSNIKQLSLLIFLIGLSSSAFAQSESAATSGFSFSNFDPNAKVSLLLAILSLITGMLFFLVQTALGSVSKIPSSDEDQKKYFWQKSKTSIKLITRMFERRCWMSGVLSHLVFLVCMTSLFLERLFAPVPMQIILITPILIIFQFLVFDLFAR